MRAVIDGWKYDTETAECAGKWANGPDSSNFNFCAEDIYRTKKGSWFLHGRGHANSPYGTSYGTSRGSGEKIVPLDEDQAMAWLEEHECPEVIEKHFSDKIQDA